MLMRRAPLAAILFFAAAALATPLQAASDADSGPSAPVARLTSTLLETMKEAATLGFEGRRDKLAPALRETFNFGFMARLSIGAQWRKLSAAEQADFVDLFARMSTATFAARFDGYSGQTFELRPGRDGPRGTRLIPTQLIHPDPGKEPVTISFLMREQGENGEVWRAVDVYLKGTYSELATKRSEYSSVIRRKGFDALVETIEARIAELRKDDGAATGKGEEG
jgi:phospholipid transport system substrate-binding protein